MPRCLLNEGRSQRGGVNKSELPTFSLAYVGATGLVVKEVKVLKGSLTTDTEIRFILCP
jgi:hypothetical protein